MGTVVNNYKIRTDKSLAILGWKRYVFHNDVPYCSKAQFQDVMAGNVKLSKEFHFNLVNRLQDLVDEVVIKSKQDEIKTHRDDAEKRLVELKQAKLGFSEREEFPPRSWEFSEDDILDPVFLGQTIGQPDKEEAKILFGEGVSHPSVGNLSQFIASEFNQIVNGIRLNIDRFPRKLKFQPLTRELARSINTNNSQRFNRRILEDLFPYALKRKHAYDFDSIDLLEAFPYPFHLPWAYEPGEPLATRAEPLIRWIFDAGETPPPTGRYRVTVEHPQALDAVKHSLVMEIINRYCEYSIRSKTKVHMQRGCTQYVFELDAIDAEKLIRMLGEKRFIEAGFKIISVESDATAPPIPAETPSLVIESGAPPTEGDVYNFMAEVGRP